MKIDGKVIADRIINNLTVEVVGLKKRGIVPTLAVIQVGENPGSTTYISQKKKAADRIGVRVIHEKFRATVSPKDLIKKIQVYNSDPSVHGLIIQRPLPVTRNTLVLHSTRVFKDVDGFLPRSPFPVPVAAAVFEIFRFTFSQLDSLDHVDKFDAWLEKRHIVVIGRGETAGKPIAETLIKHECSVTVIHSQSPHPDDVIRKGDIVISCVGKSNIVRHDNVKQGAILLGVGIRRDNNEKLQGDFDEEEIKDIVSYYTPTPGGVGPVNVACLMQNLVKACTMSLGGAL